MFGREALLASDWYRERLEVKQERDIALWQRHVQNLELFLERNGHVAEAERMRIDERLRLLGES